MKLPPPGTRGVVIPKAAKLLMKPGMAMMNFMLRKRGDKMKVQGQNLLKLTTIGAKSSKRRESILARFADPGHPGAWLVIGSNGGAAQHPAWCYNLVKNPDQAWITAGEQETQVHPEALEGTERQRAWDRVVSLAPGYGRYTKKTDREIPVIRLTPTVVA